MAEMMIYTQAQPLTVKEYQGQRVITFKDIDTLHQRASGTASRNFRANRERFIEGEDYFTVELTDDEIRRQFGAGKNAGRSVILLTKMGYLMLVKSLNDDLAWLVQRQLVKSYFESQNIAPRPVAPVDDLSASFLQAIQEAIDSGLYYIRPKYKRYEPGSMTPFGVYDGNDVYLLSQLAYGLYAASVSNPVSFTKLWTALDMAGTIMPRQEVGRITIIPGKERGVIGLNRNRLRLSNKRRW